MTSEAEARGIGIRSVKTTGPAAYSREAEAIAALKLKGFTGEFVVEDGQLRLSGTDRRFGARELRIQHFVRFEGASDPADMSVIYAIEARDGTRGILVDAFGTYADPAVGALVDRIRMASVNRHRRMAVAAAVVVAAGVVGWALVRLASSGGELSLGQRPAPIRNRIMRRLSGTPWLSSFRHGVRLSASARAYAWPPSQPRRNASSS